MKKAHGCLPPKRWRKIRNRGIEPVSTGKKGGGIGEFDWPVYKGKVLLSGEKKRKD